MTCHKNLISGKYNLREQHGQLSVFQSLMFDLGISSVICEIPFSENVFRNVIYSKLGFYQIPRRHSLVHSHQ